MFDSINKILIRFIANFLALLVLITLLTLPIWFSKNLLKFNNPNEMVLSVSNLSQDYGDLVDVKAVEINEEVKILDISYVQFANYLIYENIATVTNKSSFVKRMIITPINDNSETTLFFNTGSQSKPRIIILPPNGKATVSLEVQPALGTTIPRTQKDRFAILSISPD